MTSNSDIGSYEKIGKYDYFGLIDTLLKDIQHLETEIVRTRFELSKHLPYPTSVNIRRDIFANLAGRYGDNLAYQIFVLELYNGKDPMDSDEWVRHITDVADGKA